MSVLVIEQNIGVATRDLEERRHHGQWPRQSHHRLTRALRPTANCSSACLASASLASMPGRDAISKPQMQRRGRRRVPRRRAPRARRRSGSTSPIPRCRRAGRSRRRSRASRPPRARFRRALRGSKTPHGKSAGRRGRTGASGPPVVLVAGTLDTKGEELRFIRDLIAADRACGRGWSTSPPAASSPPATSPRRKSR